MNKFIYWNSIIGLILSQLLIWIGAWFFVSYSDKTTGQNFFKFGLIMMVSSLAWFVATMLRNRNKKKASI